MALLTRRAAVALLGSAAVSFAAGSPIRLGGPVFRKSADPKELAREHRRLGYSAAYCPDAKTTDTAYIRAIRDGFASEDVVIAEVGAWKNMLDPDERTRRENIAYVTDRLALADAVGARCCVDIAGSYHPKVWYGPHPKNLSREFLEATVENCRKVIDAVRPSRTTFAVEMMGWAIPDGPDSYLELIRAVDRPAFAVHLDVCNGINSPRRFYRNAEFIAECVRKLGRHIASCHAKDLDFVPEMNVHFVEVIPGRGQIDYRAYLSELAKLPQSPPLMLEHLKDEAEYDLGRQYILKTGREVGVRFA